jgi:hypothetical protein
MEPQICGDLEEMRRYRGKRKPRTWGRGFSGRDMPHNAEGGPDPGTCSQAEGGTMAARAPIRPGQQRHGDRSAAGYHPLADS